MSNIAGPISYTSSTSYSFCRCWNQSCNRHLIYIIPLFFHRRYMRNEAQTSFTKDLSLFSSVISRNQADLWKQYLWKPVTLSWVVLKQPVKKSFFFLPVKFITAEFCTVFFSRVGTETTRLSDERLMTMYIVTKSLFLFCYDLWLM